MENVRPGSRGDAKPGARKRSLSNAEAHTHLRLSKALAHIKPPQLSDHTLYLSMTIITQLISEPDGGVILFITPAVQLSG